MMLAMHQTTSAGAGYRKSLEGWSRAGIKYVELSNVLLDEFLKTEDLAAARRVLTDLGLTPVQGATGVTGLWEPNPNRYASIEKLKNRCETYATLGLRNVYATTLTTQKVLPDDYKTGADNMHEAGEIVSQFNSVAQDRIRTHIDVHLDAADSPQDDACGGASEPGAHVRLLSLLVGPQQAGGYGSDIAW